MEDIELQNIWKAYDQKLEESRVLNMQSWALNLQSFSMMQSIKAKSKLQGLSRYKVRVLVFGLCWVLFVGVLVAFTPFYINPYFSISALAVLLINITCMGGYIYHITLISQIGYDGNIADTQQKLARLQDSTLTIIRIGWLQAPFYTTFFWHKSWANFSDPYFLFISVPITLFFAWMAIYLYLNTTPKGLQKKWMRKLVAESPEYKSVVTAGVFMKEIEAFRENL